MDFGFSPHREGGTLHLPSPTHPHSYRLEATHFSHLQQLRRSLSRSPSKPSRFQLRTTDSPRSPLSPLGLARAFSPKAVKPTSPTAAYPESPLAVQAPTTKRFSLRRSQPFRASPRTRNSKSKSPRRPLGDSTDTGNSTTPFMARPTPGQENTPRRPSAESPESMDTDQRPVDDKPIKFAFAQSRPDLSPLPPAKSSPLKRNDALMNLNGDAGNSPTAKRRSVQGASNLGVDFASIFDQTPARNDESPRVYNDTTNFFSPVHTPGTPVQTPVRRTTSLRKSTLRSSNTPRAKPAFDGDFAIPGAAASKTRNRMSLDSTLGQSTTPAQTPFAHTPFRNSTFDAARMGLPQPHRTSFGNGQPHPLSHAHTPNSASSSTHGDTPMAPPRSSVFGFPQAAPSAPSQLFSRSLPLGIGRPTSQDGEDGSHDSFDTPFKVVPQPAMAFSTGLLSKKNRNVDEPAAGAGIYVMPDTPSKRQSFPPAAGDRAQNLDTPLVKRKGSLFGESARPQHQFGTPSTPFSANVSKFSVETMGKRSSIFGNMSSSLQRRGSFVSIDGVDGDDDTPLDTQSPTANRTMTDSQSSAEDMPPTPTKPSGGSSRRSKESSLRRKTFRGRPSIGADTFAAPDHDSIANSKYTSEPIPASTLDEASSILEESPSATCDTPSTQTPSFPRSRLLRRSKKLGRPSPLPRRTLRPTTSIKINTKTTTAAGDFFGVPSPSTPSESFDASKLSFSGPRRDDHPFAQSMGALRGPATPTTPRENHFFHSVQGVIPIGLTKNDVDESLAERFNDVKQLDGGEGEFSTVYRVGKPVKISPGRSPAGSQVWVVKKSKKPYTGAGDRSRKMREVDVLYALRGNDHVLDIKTHWEADSHLYIQTEYCEGGNLRRYLDNMGFNSRLDDFRIWKILLELSMVSTNLSA
jgi:mitosis inhibitor protein kinase SWE1